MKNFLQPGQAIDIVAPQGGLTAGQYYRIGGLAGVVASTAAEGETTVLHLTGVYTLPKKTGTAWSVGDVLYWDASNAEFTKTGGANSPAGVAAAAAASGDATGAVRLDPGPLRMVVGEIALDGSNPTPVATGLSAIVGAVVALKTASAPGVGTSIVTYNTSGGTLNLYGWKVTANNDTTLIASTGTETVGYAAWGY
jgi:predicted RecA/RadA family phage recombinase